MLCDLTNGNVRKWHINKILFDFLATVSTKEPVIVN